MKELTIEEKAERYDKALERMKSWVRGEHPECFTEAQKAAEFIFPELKESEDEKIRKGIIRNLEYLMDRAEGFVKDELKERIAWLEKQGEQKSAWSEEDALRLEEAIYMIKARGWIRGDDAVKLVLDWLKSLKDRVSPQPKQEWSEVDEYTLNETIQHLKVLIEIYKTKHCACDAQYYQRDIDWLKSLKQRIGG